MKKNVYQHANRNTPRSLTNGNQEVVSTYEKTLRQKNECEENVLVSQLSSLCVDELMPNFLIFMLFISDCAAKKRIKNKEIEATRSEMEGKC